MIGIMAALSPDPVSRDELLRRLEREFAKLDRLLDRLTNDQWMESRALGDWSVTDVLAHLIAHESRAVEEVRLALRGERLEIDHAANDAFNERAVSAMRGQSREAVRSAWHASYRAVHELVANLPAEAFDPSGPVAALLDDTVDGALANNTYEHYAGHRAEIAALLREDAR